MVLEFPGVRHSGNKSNPPQRLIRLQPLLMADMHSNYSYQLVYIQTYSCQLSIQVIHLKQYPIKLQLLFDIFSNYSSCLYLFDLQLLFDICSNYSYCLVSIQTILISCHLSNYNKYLIYIQIKTNMDDVHSNNWYQLNSHQTTFISFQLFILQLLFNICSNNSF